uniref:Uncharacterized protein n=1 Tax=Anguilla anguilla TaxID=7936 RepID=A0A0E9SSL4_ANGAN
MPKLRAAIGCNNFQLMEFPCLIFQSTLKVS